MPYSVQPTNKNQDVAFMAEFQTLAKPKLPHATPSKQNGGKFEVLDGNARSLRSKVDQNVSAVGSHFPITRPRSTSEAQPRSS